MPASPSLLIVPARFKTGKLYTQIATTSAGLVLGSSGDFNVTRATTATRFNSAGLIESVASGVPRLDYYTSGGTAGCPALLVEPSGSNLALQSEDFTLSANWNTSVAGRTLVTGNVTATRDPYGGNVADLLSDDNTASSTHRMYTAGNISITSGTTYSTSFFVKANTTPWFEIRLMQSSETDAGIVGTVFNLTSGTITSGSGTIQNYGNGWYRCTNIGTSNFTGNGRIFFYVYNSSGTKSYNGTSSNSLYIFGAQLETGTVATSYIPTTTAAVTRNAEVINLSGAVSGCIGQTDGTLYLDLSYGQVTSTATRWLELFGSSNHIGLAVGTAGLLRSIVNGQSDILAGTETSTRFKIAWSYNSSGVVCFINGVQFTLTNGGAQTMTSLTGFKIDMSTLGGQRTFNNRINAFAFYTSRLTNAELAALTTL